MNREEAKKKAEVLVARMTLEEKAKSAKVRCTCNKKTGNSGI